MSIQQGINQLLGISMIGAKFSPGVEKRAELREIERQGKNLLGQTKYMANEYVEAGQKLNTAKENLGQVQGIAEDPDLSPKFRAEVEKDLDRATKDVENAQIQRDVTGEFIDEINQRGAALAEQKFKLDPSTANAKDLMAWRGALKKIDLRQQKAEEAEASMQASAAERLNQQQKFDAFKKLISGEMSREEYMNQYGGNR